MFWRVFSRFGNFWWILAEGRFWANVEQVSFQELKRVDRALITFRLLFLDDFSYLRLFWHLGVNFDF